MSEVDMLYSRNKRQNKQIALAILGLQIVQVLGITKMFGLDLAQLGFAGMTALALLQIVGLSWVAIGLWKYKLV